MKKTWFDGRARMMTWLACIGLATLARAQTVISPPNYTITTPGGQFEFNVNGSNASTTMGAGINDSLNFSLNAGATYIFSVNTASIHPMDINTAPNTLTASRYSGVSLQGTSGPTNVILTLPATNYPTTLYYICQIHSFYGIITVNPPQPPPTAKILKTAVTTNIVLTFSGGTNTISLVPQFSSNLQHNVWLPVPKYTNTYSGNGTNTTSFGRLDAICGPDVYIRISQAAN